MPSDATDASVNASARDAGALLLCRAEPDAIAPTARLLGDPLLLVPAGPEWTALVPEGSAWRLGEPVDRVLAGWATALAVGAPWPVLALWWDADRGGYTLASGFRRSVGYIWLANGTPVGEDEAMHTFAARLGLDPVLDMQSLDALTCPGADDARARLLGLLAVLTRAGLRLPTGLAPGEPADHLRKVALAHPDVRPVDEHDTYGAGTADGSREANPAEGPGPRDAARAPSGADEAPAAWMRARRIRAMAAGIQVAAGLPLVLWGARRRSGGWAFAGLILIAHGVRGLVHDMSRDGHHHALGGRLHDRGALR